MDAAAGHARNERRVFAIFGVVLREKGVDVEAEGECKGKRKLVQGLDPRNHEVGAELYRWDGIRLNALEEEPRRADLLMAASLVKRKNKGRLSFLMRQAGS
jgi:hypothetical protein